MKKKLKNRFDLFEWSGAFGDIGLLLPLAFAFCLFNGFAPRTLFLLWGAAYVATGYYFKMPIAVQPLKAMAVIAITAGFSQGQMASTAVFYGLIFILISVTGLLKLVQPLFTPPIVRGIQVGVGLILVHKALAMVIEKGLYLGWEKADPLHSVPILVATVLVLWYFQFKKQWPVTLLLLFGSLLLGFLLGVRVDTASFTGGALVSFSLPDWGFLLSALVYLVLPQLPLTIGNAVFAASDICRQLWKERSHRVNPTKLGLSIGILNVVIGLFGGFPICHGSGGMAAHHQFGGKTGGATMIIGAGLIVTALVPSLAHFIFYIPIPMLGALLFITGLKMIFLIKNLENKRCVVVAGVVALIAFFVNNLLIAMVAGIVLERSLNLMIGLGWFSRAAAKGAED